MVKILTIKVTNAIDRFGKPAVLLVGLSSGNGFNGADWGRGLEKGKIHFQPGDGLAPILKTDTDIE